MPPREGKSVHEVSKKVSLIDIFCDNIIVSYKIKRDLCTMCACS